tara:strand:- start:11 stop:244 length:234 start_codon:yes stop_codon:yes gene_type:complete
MTERYIVVLDKGQLQELEKLCELRRQVLQQDGHEFPNAKMVKHELGQLKTIWQAFDRKSRLHLPKNFPVQDLGNTDD